MDSQGEDVSRLPVPGRNTRCPFCGTKLVFQKVDNMLALNCFAADEGESGIPLPMLYFELDYTENCWAYKIIGSRCASCNQVSIVRQKAAIANATSLQGPWDYVYVEKKFEDDILLWPRGIRRPIPEKVTPEIRKDYNEACGTLYVSPRASAALARRCLQNLLRTKAGVHEKNLFQEIEKVLYSQSLPTLLQKSLHLIRNLGIIAAHPLQDTETDEIIEIDEEEIELVLDVLGQLIGYYYETVPKLEETAKKVEEKVTKQKGPPKKK